MAGHSILIVEDEPLIAMMLEDFLDSLGHTVRGSCDTVQCALDEVEKGGFDLAILGLGPNGHLGFNDPPCGPDARTRPVCLTAQSIER